MNYIGAKITGLKPGFCEITLPFSSDLLQQHGFFHGGLVGTLCDNASGFSAYSLMDENEQPLTTEFKVNLLAPAKGVSLVSRGHVVKDGKTIKVCQSDVWCVDKNGKRTHCAVAIVSVMALGSRTAD